MESSLICHILIGPPASGKSTLATALATYDPRHKIVSTDQIREELFGDSRIQGSWSLIEDQVLTQIAQAIAAGRPVIYDATNANPGWRIELLQKLACYTHVQWIGWWLDIPLEECQQRNQRRDRQVPEVVIEQLWQALKINPPQISEGFMAVHRVPLRQGQPDLAVMLAEMERYQAAISKNHDC